MGMFDYVDREPMFCPYCKGEIVEFQTKSGDNQLKHYSEEELVEVADKYDCSYYGWCEKCGRNTVYMKYVPEHWEYIEEEE